MTDVAAGAEGATAPLDVLLVDGALGPLRRFVPGRSEASFASALARRPALLARRGGSLLAELGRVAAGRSALAPGPKDRRFADRGWQENPLLHRLVQAYLAAGATAGQLVEDAELDWRTKQRVRFLVDNLVEAAAPSNSPLHPAAVREGISTGGANYARGLKALVKDLSSAPRVPSMVAPDAFAVGEDLAVTPGAVVLRTPVFELLQYAPSTPTVREIPLVMVPPTINKYYVTDLAPGRSMVEYYVGSGQQVFLLSWRNPDARHRSWGLDTYVAAIIEAMDAVERITGADRSILFGLCSGGILSTLALAHLAATGRQDRVAGLTLGVTVLDQASDRPGSGAVGALLDPRVARAAAAVSERRGYLDGRALAEVFAWLRPGDLVWNYWVNNYLLGKPPPAFDVLYWNADTTRMAAGLHRDFLQLAVDNALVRPGQARVLGTPVELSAVTVDSYVVAGIADHLCPWQSCYRTTALLGGTSRFVLSTSGHVAALVNPPGNPKSNYRVTDAGIDDERNPPAAEDWLRAARVVQGSWWEDFVPWLRDHSGEEKAAPTELGGPAGSGLEPLDEAPGRYVYDR